MCNLLVGMFGRTFNRIRLVVRNYVCCCFSESATEAKKKAEEEELEQLKLAIISEEDYYGVIPILMIGDSTSALLAEIVDDPEFSAYSLKDSAGVDSFDVSKQEQFKFLQSKFKPYAIILVYDATAIESFNKAEMWLEKIAIPANASVCMLLVGNDHDLDNNDDSKVVETTTGEELARRFKISFIETSAENPAKLEQALSYMTGLIESSKIYKTGAIQMEG